MSAPRIKRHKKSESSSSRSAAATNHNPTAPRSIRDLNIDVAHLTPRERVSYRDQVNEHLADLFERLNQARSAAASSATIDVTAASPRASQHQHLFHSDPAKASSAPSAPDSPAPPQPASTNAHEPGHSTGPLTAEGKARSAQNAFVHGLAASPGSTMLFLAHEDPEEHERLRLAFTEQFVPITPAEHELIREIADSLWLARRARDLQTLELGCRHPQTDRLALYLRYETAHTRAHQAAIKTLLTLQKDRRQRNQHHEKWNEPLAWGLADRVELQRQMDQQSTLEFDDDDLEQEERERVFGPTPAAGTSFRNPSAAASDNPFEPTAPASEPVANFTEEEVKPAA